VILEVNDLEVSYGAIDAIKGVSFSVGEREIVTLVGANGAGKTSILRGISGLVDVKGGSILYDGKEIHGIAPHEIVRLGISHVPEGRHAFLNLSVQENLQLGAFIRTDASGIKEDMEKVYELFPRLKERVRQLAGTLSGGDSKCSFWGAR
jgi:branched-chain amino acid transport system ATP-binding protein